MKMNLQFTAAILILATFMVASPHAGLSQAPCVTDNFDDGNANGWSPLNASRWQVSSDVGSLRYFLNTSDYNTPDGIRLGELSLLSSYKWGDFAFECLAKSADAAIGASAADLCIVFGFQDFDSYYYVNFNSEPGLTALHRINNGADANLASYNQATFADGNYHTLRVERTGSQIRAFFDGQQLFSITDSFFGKGEIGLGSFNDSGYFDDVSISGDVCSGAFTDISALPFGVEYGSSAIWGDYDNDGDLDILLTGGVTLNRAFSALYRNDPAGSGRDFVNVGSPITGLTNSSLAWGDYDNDGDLDILFDGTYSFGNPGDPIIPTAGVLRNDGGSFVAAGTNLTPGGSVAWGDFDNDGDLDILLGQKVYRNDGGNFFDLGVALTGGNATAWGDYDNDGDLDILAAPKIYRNDGGNFLDSNVALTGVVSGSGHWGDYDNDGDLDILLMGFSSPNPNPNPVNKIYRNEGGNFVDIGAALPGVGGSSAAWGDYDNDGDLDILLTDFVNGVGNVSTVYRNDNGTFVDINAQLLGVGSVAWGDYDNDGDLDILLTGGSNKGPMAKIYRNNIGTPNTVPTAPANLSAIVAGRAVTLSWNKSTDNQTVQNALTYNLRIGRTPGGSEIMSPMSEAGSGYRRVPRLGNTNHRNSWTIQNLPPGTYYWSVQAIDHAFDGSAFAAEQSFVIASPSFTGISAILAAGDEGAAAWGDYDNDGDLDILLTGDSRNPFAKIYRNDGNGNFIDIAAALAGTYAGPAVWVDYDNDGDLDVWLGGFFDGLYRNDAGSFVPISTTLGDGLRGAIAWGDYDNDGDLDVLLTGAGGGPETTRIYRNDGGIFVDINAGLVGVYSSAAAWGDYDNDGDFDILLTGLSGAITVTKIYRNDSGSFADIAAPLAQVYASAAAWGDYDSDGDLDIVLSGFATYPNGTGVTKIYRNDAGNFVDIAAPLTGVGYSSIAWGDYDNDGDLDILSAGENGSSRTTSLYRNDGGNFVNVDAGLAGISGAAVGGWGDYDNDGDLDILLTGRDNNDQHLSKIYRNNVQKANIAPTAPTGLVAVETGNAITFKWNKSSDSQTVQQSLTYNLRVGKTPGGSEIVAPMANASTGYRLVSKLGNTNHNASWTIQNLPPGTYYWSVQAIDHAFAGSAFGVEQNFTIIPEAFTEISTPLAGISADAVEWGDYDDDGDLDILLSGSDVAKIYRNDNGSFIDIAANLTGVSLSDVAWGDYDNDGDLDILLTGLAASGRISKIYRNDGGTFVDINAALTGVSNSAVAWGDYDNDGSLDILLTGLVLSNNEVFSVSKIYRNDGGNFLDINAPLPPAAGGSVAWGDYDNDGDMDILLTGLGAGQLAGVLRNDGGNFVAINASLRGVSQSSAVWGDYDNDGDLDILLTGGFRDEITIPVARVYRNDAGNFIGTNGGQLTGVYKSSAAWGDYDNDGDLDILLAGSTSILGASVTKVYRNDTGNFVEINATLAGISDGEVTWGDYDNDGDLDILLAGASNSGFVTKIYRNNVEIKNTTPASPVNLAVTTTDSSVTFSWAKSTDNETPINGLTYNLRLGTTPGGVEKKSPMTDAATGYRHVVQLGNTNHNNSWTIKNLPPGTYYWSVQAIDNAFAGSAFAPEQSFTISEPFTELVALPGAFGSVAWGDYDNDGDLDILVGAKIYRNDNGNFVDTGTLEAEGKSWGDYDNDGDLDILARARVYRNDNGNFVNIFLANMSPSASIWADYDNDGDLDILLTGQDFNLKTITKLYRNDAGLFVEVTVSLPGVNRGSAAWGDYDNDGDLDILLTGVDGNFKGFTKLYRNDAGSFVDMATPLAEVEGAGAWGDYDNDGDLDILLTGHTGATRIAKIYRNDSGNFADINAALIGLLGSAAWGDYDNDGDLDILLTGRDANLKPLTRVYRNDSGNFVDLVATLPNLDFAAAAWGDYDNDGDLDILLAGYDVDLKPTTKILRNNIAVKNTNPTLPTALAATVTGNIATLSWNKSTDGQTAANGLTYNLRIGKTPGGNEIVSPMSEAGSGFRQVPQLGNVNHNIRWTIKNLPNGTYYWSVQALDHAFAGSSFAAEQSFIVANPISAPQHLLAIAGQSKITFFWTANTESNLLRYRIYRSTASPATTKIDSVAAGVTKYIDSNVTSGTTYYYRITAVNQVLQESPFSNEVSASLTAAAFSDFRLVSGGTAWGDYDNDGDLDILAVSKVYRNDPVSGRNNFVVGATTGGLAWVDYDNDDDLDIFSGSKIYCNDNGNFVGVIDVTLPGASTGSHFWGDYDNDGDLDILLIGQDNNSKPITKIYRNDNGLFVDAVSLIAVSNGTAAWGDYDNDGDLDIVLAGFGVSSRIAKIYRNDGGSFVDIAAPLQGVIEGSVAWGDYDNDGDLDIVLSGNVSFATDMVINTAGVYRNDNGIFGHGGASLTGVRRSAVAWGDYDNDGDLDVLLTGLTSETPIGHPSATVYRNDGGRFESIASNLPGDFSGTVAWGDYDNDGDLDILMSGQIFRNNIGAENTAPSAPTNLVATAVGSSINFSWNKATDNQTAQNGLVYNLRLGTTPNGVEKLSPMADLVNGFRRVVQLGNTNHNTSWTIKNLPKGKYYWSVQAIDNAFAGSTFAPEQTFVLGDTVWPGDTNNNRLVNQADVLPIGLYWNKTGSKRDDASVIWKGQVALPWSPEAATFADANGDGIVNQADVLPIGLNWGQTQTASTFVLGKGADASAATAATSTLGVKITGDTNPGKDFWLDVQVDSVKNLFGISFELLYSSVTYVRLDSIIAGKWLGSDLVFFSTVDTTAGKISLAVSRKAGQGGRDSSGAVARIKMRMSSAAVIGQITALVLQNVVANDPAGNPIQFNAINGSIITSVASRQQNEQLPQAFALHPNFPNPFNPSTMIKYDLPEAAEIRLDIFDMLGRRVRSLVNQRQQAGRYSVVWDGCDETGRTVASGAYIFQLRAADPVKGGAGKFVQSRKLMLVR